MVRQGNRPRVLAIATIMAATASLAVPTTTGASERAPAEQSARQAAGPPSGINCSKNGWTHACFAPKGDVIWVRDTREDGHHADVYFWGWDGSDGRQHTCHDRLGKKAGWTYCDQFAKLIPEHSSLTLWPVAADKNEKKIPNSGGSRFESSTT